MRNFNFYKCENAEIIYIKNLTINFNEHCHTDDFVFTLILKGSVNINKEKNIEKLATGDVFSVVPYQSHFLVSDGCADMLSVCIKKKVIYDFTVGSFFEFVNKLMNAISEYIDIDVKIIENEIHKIYTKYNSKANAIKNVFEISREKIVQNPEDEKTLEEYAKEIYVSKFYYIRKIKECSGLTPHKLIIQSRIRKAQQLLCSGSDIVQTALTVGFYDQSHFNKYFNKIIGIPPTEYLRSLSNFLQE